MRLYRFDDAAARPIADWGTRAVAVVEMLQLADEADVSYLRYGPGSVLGRHPTGRQQLFAVVGGEGWVSGPDGVRRRITAGQAAYWDVGESHESGTESGMTVVVIQAPHLDPTLPALD
jgi:hypothetical protein